MTHLESFSSYLKVNWAKKFLLDQTGIWQSVIGAELDKYGGERLFTLQRDKVKCIAEKLHNPFWKDVLLGFYFAKPKLERTMPDLLSLDILNFVEVEDFPFFMRWKSFGIKNLFDLIDIEKSDFCSFENIREKCHTGNFLKYYCLLSNIPGDIKIFVKTNLQNFQSYNFVPCDSFTKRLLLNKSIKFVYNYMVHQVAVQPFAKVTAWEKILDCEIDDWPICFDIVKRACRDPYIRNFQYKFLHQIIPTNIFLHKIHLQDTKLCSFCKNQDETIGHLFFDCPIISDFWNVFF